MFHRARLSVTLPIASALLAACVLVALLIGPAALSATDVLRALVGEADDRTTLIVWSLRVPRTAMAAMVGATLALAGTTLQALFRNPLADPALLGISSGAAMVVAVGVAVAPALLQTFGQPLLAFAGGMGAVFVVTRLGTSGGRSDVALMLLAGIAINALAAAVIGGAFVFADDAELRSVVFWTLGSFAQVRVTELFWSSPLMVVGAIALLRGHRALDALTLGEADAHHLGIRVERTKRRILLATSLVVGAGVASVGVVGFVGLVVPHAVRLLLGPAHRSMLPLSGVIGAALLVVADAVARGAHGPAELPVGVLTAALGAPFFLGLLVQRRGI